MTCIRECDGATRGCPCDHRAENVLMSRQAHLEKLRFRTPMVLRGRVSDPA